MTDTTNIEAPTVPAPGTVRAVYCCCCSAPTGEFLPVFETPSEPYCDRCRDLPAPWKVQRKRTKTGKVMVRKGEEVYETVITGRVNVPGNTDPAFIRNTLQYHRQNALTGATTRPRYVHIEDDEDEEEREYPECHACGGDRFVFVETVDGEEHHWYPVRYDDYEDAENPTHLYDIRRNGYDGDAYDEGDGDQRVECADCGRRWHGTWD